MKSWIRNLIIVLLLPLASCVNAGKMDEIAVKGGIGGTGITTWDGGIGGTGVVGTVTGFGSIIINGLHIYYEPGQPVESANGQMTGADFAIGQVIAAQTKLQNAKLVATRLIAQTPLIGLVEAINVTTGEMIVLGEKVALMNNVELGMGSIANINVSDTVMVSGHRGKDGVLASRIDFSNTNISTGISGTITAVSNDSITIDGVHRVRSGVGKQARVSIGDYINVSGLTRSSDGHFTAKTMTRYYGPMFDGSVVRMAVEGVFGKNSYGVPGVGILRDMPIGRAVVFVTKDQQSGQILLDGATSRPQESWRDNLRFRQPGQDSVNGDKNKKTARDKSRSSDKSGGGGGGSGGGGKGGR